MTEFQQAENHRQSEFKKESAYFSDHARSDGVYLRSMKNRNKPIPVSYCVPVIYAEENLFPEIRAAALAYFHEYDIQWHDQTPGHKPSNNLRDSQVSCVNFLFAFASRPEALTDLLRPIFPAISRFCRLSSPTAMWLSSG